MAKIRLLVKVRDRDRCRIESVPLKRLVKLSVYDKRHWCLQEVDGYFWLILEAF